MHYLFHRLKKCSNLSEVLQHHSGSMAETPFTRQVHASPEVFFRNNLREPNCDCDLSAVSWHRDNFGHIYGLWQAIWPGWIQYGSLYSHRKLFYVNLFLVLTLNIIKAQVQIFILWRGVTDDVSYWYWNEGNSYLSLQTLECHHTWEIKVILPCL